MFQNKSLHKRHMPPIPKYKLSWPLLFAAQIYEAEISLLKVGSQKAVESAHGGLSLIRSHLR